MNVNSRGQNARSYFLKLRRIHCETARKQEGWRIRISPGFKGEIINDTGLISEPAQGAPQHRILLVCPRPDQICIRTPKELYINGGVGRSAEEILNFQFFHAPKHIHGIGVNARLYRAILANDPESALTQKVTLNELAAIVPVE